MGDSKFYVDSEYILFVEVKIEINAKKREKHKKWKDRKHAIADFS